MARPFTHSLSSPVVFGPGVSSTLGEKTLLKRCSRVGVVTDKVVRGIADDVVKGLGDKVVFVDDGCVPDADVAHVDATAAKAKEANVDALVAVGGGSVLDTAKGVAAALGKGRPIVELEGIATIKMKLVPLVCVPTTAGTGSEATQFCVLKDRAAQRKRIYTDQSLVPALAVLDPTLCTGLPRAVTAATAVDAITHAVEALASKLRNPVGDALAFEAVRLLIVERALERSLEDGADLDARGDCLVAANLAGQAVTTSMLGACHALAHVAGAFGGVPHGVANGLFLTSIMKANAAKAGAAYARLGGVLGVAAASDDVAAVISLVDHVIHEVAGLPRRLRDAAPSLREEQLPMLAKAATLDIDLPTNPVALDEAALLTHLRERW